MCISLFVSCFSFVAYFFVHINCFCVIDWFSDKSWYSCIWFRPDFWSGMSDSQRSGLSFWHFDNCEWKSLLVWKKYVYWENFKILLWNAYLFFVCLMMGLVRVWWAKHPVSCRYSSEKMEQRMGTIYNGS